MNLFSALNKPAEIVNGVGTAVNTVAPIVQAALDPAATAMSLLSSFSIDTTSIHEFCEVRNTYSVFPELLKLPPMGAVAPGGAMGMSMMSSAMASLPGPSIPGVTTSVPIPGFVTVTKNVNLSKAKEFTIKYVFPKEMGGLKFPFLKVKRSGKCFCDIFGWGCSAKIIDIRQGRDVLLGEVHKHMSVLDYSMDILVQDNLTYRIKSVGMDLTCPLFRCSSVEFEICRFGQPGPIGKFTKVSKNRLMYIGLVMLCRQICRT
jgi:hypothetical protein